jgi:DNA polymerase-4
MELEKILFKLVEDVCSTLRSKSFLARNVTLKYRTSEFETLTRQQSIEPTNYDPVVFDIARHLLDKLHDGKISLRLIGVGLSNFVDETQKEIDLFPSSVKREKMLQAIDRLRGKYGDKSIKIGGV